MELTAFYPFGFQGFMVVGGQGQEAAHVVVHNPHVQAFLGFAFQDLQNRIPHSAFFYDKELQEDIFFCFFQFY